MKQLTLPDLPDAAEATVEHIYVATGERVLRGQPLALVRTSTFAYDIPAAESGMLLELQVVVGERLSAGQPLAVLADGEQPSPAQPVSATSTAASSAAQLPSLRATPLARRMASAHALDLALLSAAAPRLVRRRDVLRLLEAAPARRATLPGAAPRSTPGAAPRSTPGAASAPTALTAIELDWSPVDEYIERRPGRRRRGSSSADRRACLVSAAARALLRHHYVHAAWSERGILLRHGIDIRIDGRVVPGAADLSPGGVASALEAPQGDAARRAFVIVELVGALWSETALPDAASAVLCVGQAETRLRVGDDGTIAVRPISLLTLVYDARVLDQRSADAFLAELRSRLEQISSLC